MSPHKFSFIKLKTLDKSKNAVLIDFNTELLKGTTRMFLEVITAFSTWIKETRNIFACVTGDESVIKKFTQFDHFTLSTQPIHSLLAEKQVQSCQVVLVHSSIQHFVSIRQRLKKKTYLLFVPTEDKFFIPSLSDQEDEFTLVYDKRFLRFCGSIKWWVAYADKLHTLEYHPGFSLGEFSHEFVMLKEVILILTGDSLYERIEEILSYVDERSPGHYMGN